MSFEIIKAEEENIGDVYYLEKASFDLPWSEDHILSDILGGYSQYFLLYSEREPVGYLSFRLLFDEGHIINICVHPEKRGRGYGQKLIGFIEQHAKSVGAKSLTLEVRKSNTPAIELYKKMGFVVDGIRRGYYCDNGEDAYIMWKYRIYYSCTD